MRFLPKANPLYENIAASNIVIPDVLEKLASGGFTGYIHHAVPKGDFYGVFAKGRLLCALYSSEGREKSGFEALTLLFDTVLAIGGVINVYRMTADFAVCAHAQLAGTRLFSGEEVRQVDIKAVLARLKSQGVNGVVLFYTAERAAAMLYKDGLPVGFYHDGAKVIEVSPDESRKIAALPGARLEISSTKALDELMQYDLMEMVNLQKLWETAKGRVSSPRPQAAVAAAPVATAVDEKKLHELADDIAEVASAYLSRPGRTIVETRLRERGGPALLCNAATREQFLGLVRSDAEALDATARIDEMIDLMKSEIAGRLAV